MHKQITLPNLLEVAGYTVVGGTKFLWNCFGPNARFIDFYDTDDKHLSAVYDTKTQEIYYTTLSDGDNLYKWINPEHFEAYSNECDCRNIPVCEAWGDLEFTILEVEEDFMQKAHAIVNGLQYSTDIMVPITMPDDELLDAMLAAHKLNITFNEYVSMCLEKAVKELTGK